MSEMDIEFLINLICTLVGIFVGFRIGRMWKD